jgi:hypothetical protein
LDPSLLLGEIFSLSMLSLELSSPPFVYRIHCWCFCSISFIGLFLRHIIEIERKAQVSHSCSLIEQFRVMGGKSAKPWNMEHGTLKWGLGEKVLKKSRLTEKFAIMKRTAPFG